MTLLHSSLCFFRASWASRRSRSNFSCRSCRARSNSCRSCWRCRSASSLRNSRSCGSEKTSGGSTSVSAVKSSRTLFWRALSSSAARSASSLIRSPARSSLASSIVATSCTAAGIAWRSSAFNTELNWSRWLDSRDEVVARISVSAAFVSALTCADCCPSGQRDDELSSERQNGQCKCHRGKGIYVLDARCYGECSE